MAWSLAHGLCHIPATSGDGDERMGMMMNSTNSMMNEVRQIPRNHLPHVAMRHSAVAEKKWASSWRCTMNEHGTVVAQTCGPGTAQHRGERGRWEGGAKRSAVARHSLEWLCSKLQEKLRPNSHVACMHAGRP